MSDDKKTLTLKGTLGLKNTSGQASSRAGGRPTTMVVHKNKKKMPAKMPLAKAASPLGASTQQSKLSDTERQARIHALENAPQQTERDLKNLELLKAEEERRKMRLAEEQVRREKEEKERRMSEERMRKEKEEQAKRRAEEIAARAEAESMHDDPSSTNLGNKKEAYSEDGDDIKARKAEQKKRPANAGKPREERRGGGGRLNLNAILDEEEEEFQRSRSLASIKRMRAKEKQKQLEAREANEKIVREVIIPETILVGDLANRMAVRAADVIKELMKNNILATQNQYIDGDTAELVVAEFGHKVKRVSESDVEDVLLEENINDSKNLQPRAPVVTVMGHVDHGKTSLLDALRQTDVVAGEAGGITQHIGAYQVHLENGQHVTFIDTPGHAAFSEMRARGAKVTDVVVLVVAADDGIQPQTVEAINHAKAADVPIVVAINKCDKPDADPNRIRTQLLEHNVVIEDMGGDVQAVNISAKTHENLDKLIESILILAELAELKSDPDRVARGVVVESKLEKGRGAVATVLVQSGTLKLGDIFVTGKEFGKVRALLNERGHKIDTAGPSTPVEVLGLNGAPEAGDDFVVVETESKAREIANYRNRKAKETRIASANRGTLEQMFDQIKTGEIQELTAVVKADVQGSVEAITASFDKIATDEVKVNVIHSGVGGITQSDVTLANSTNGIVIGFNVRANPQARDLAQKENVDIRYYSIIYDIIDDMKNILSGLLAPEEHEDFLGYAEIRDVFNVSKMGKIAGCMITSGEVRRGSKVRLLRDDVVIFEGNLKQLKRFKDDVKEVREGYECGIALENYDDIKAGDVIECFEMRQVARQI